MRGRRTCSGLEAGRRIPAFRPELFLTLRLQPCLGERAQVFVKEAKRTRFLNLQYRLRGRGVLKLGLELSSGFRQPSASCGRFPESCSHAGSALLQLGHLAESSVL